MATKEKTEDPVDRNMAEWPSELEGIDLDVEAAVQRMQRIVKAIGRRMDAKLAEKHGLSSGAMTNRLDRLEHGGLIRRQPDPNDRRALYVELTEKGHQTWMDALNAQASKEAVLASSLNSKELRQLNDLLRKVLLEFER